MTESRVGQKKPKVLLVRLDKIGDLVSTMPVDAIFPDSEFDVEWVVSQGLGFIAECAVPPRRYTEIPLGKEKGREGARQFRQILSERKPDMVVIFYAPWWAAFESFKARIARRVGRQSQWHSFVFLNSSLRQSRSLSEKHEAEYNFEIAKFALKTLTGEGSKAALPILKLKAPMLRQLFEKFDIQPQSYILLHPGMAGSALNWPVTKYQELVAFILHQNPKLKILITGTDIDANWTKPVLDRFKNEKRLLSAVNQVSLKELLFLLEHAKAVVAPSTGVAHLAASLGVPTRAIYSPVRAHSAKRWGPRGAQVQIFEPQESQPGQENESMASISPSDVLGDLGD